MSVFPRALPRRSARAPAVADRAAERFVALARVTAPDTTHVVERRRLLEAIAATSAKMVWIGGIAGSGKTTLAADHARRSPARVVWLRLDALDRDPAGYFVHLGGALRAAGVHGANTLPTLSADRLGALQIYAQEYFQALFRACGNDCVLVHDDIHLLGAEGPTVDLLAALLHEAPPAARLVMTSREGPPASLARGIANGEVWILPGDSLALSEEETRQIVRSWDPAPAPAQAATLHRRTEGWVGGLALLRASARACDGARDEDAQALLGGYFESEVLGRLTAADRAALRRVAWLPAVRADLARAVTGDDTVCTVLRDLSRQGLFVSTHGGGEPEFVLHALFAEHLRRRASEELPPADVAALECAAADALALSEDVEASVALYLDAGALERAAAAMSRVAPVAFREARLNTLAGWARALPDAVLREHPWLCYWLAMCVLMTDPAQGRERMLIACHGFRERGDTRGRLLALSYLIGSYFMSYSSVHPLGDWVDEIGRLGDEFDALPDTDSRASAALSVWYGLFLVQPDHADLPLWESRLADLLRRRVDPTIKLRIGMMLSKHYYYTGQFGKIWPLRALLLTERESPALSPYGHLLWFLYSLPDCWSRGDFDEARRELEQALARARRYGIHLLDNHCVLHTVTACLLDGALDEAAQLLERVPLGSDSTRHMEVWHLYLGKAWQACLSGRHVEAAEYAAVCRAAGRDMGGVAPQGFALAAQAWIAVARAQADEAAQHLAALDTLVTRTGNPLLAFHAGLISARLALDAGDRTRCRDLLRTALAGGREHAWLHFQWAVPELLAPLCQVALEHDVEPDYVRDLVRARRMQALAAPAHLASWPWQVKLHTLGRFEVLLDGQPLAHAGKAQTRTLTLLKAILAFGADQVDSASLCDALWPDADGDAAQHALESALYRLRKLIGKDAVLMHDGKVSLCWTRCWWDARALEHLGAAVPDARERRRLAGALYRGPFLAGDADLSFAMPPRERLAGLASTLLA